MKADGTGLVRLTNDGFRDRAPSWSVGTGDLTPNDTLVAVSPDSKSAYFVRTETVTNLWMIGK